MQYLKLGARNDAKIASINAPCYNSKMSFHTNIRSLWQSHITRQLLGGIAGMLAAVVIYGGIEQFNNFHAGQALLISPNNISTNAGTVTTDVKNVDESTQRRLEKNAQNVAQQMTKVMSSSPALTSVQARLAARERQLQQFTAQQVRPSAPTYAVTNTETDQLARLRQRNLDAFTQREASATAAISSSPDASQAQPTPDNRTTIVAVAETSSTATNAAHAAPPARATEPKLLTNSGPTEQILMIVSLLLCVAFTLANTEHRNRLIAIVKTGQ